MQEIIAALISMVLALSAVATQGIHPGDIREPANSDQATDGIITPSDSEDGTDSLAHYIEKLVERLKSQAGVEPSIDELQQESDGNTDSPCVTEHASGEGWSRTVVQCSNVSESENGSTSSSSISISSSSSTSTD